MLYAAVAEPTRVDALIERYDGFLLDAYGVLKDSTSALPGAIDLLDRLRRAGKPFVIVTNDASRLPATVASALAAIGLIVPAADIVTSGSLLTGHFAAAGLAGARCLVLGTADARQYVADAGGVVTPLAADADVDALIVCDDSGYDFLPGMNAALSAAVRALDAGRVPALVLPNPDLVYPPGPGRLAFTAGTCALMIETALRRRYPGQDLAFVHLGKPRPAMFEEGRRRLGVARPLMIGDQLETDIAGAVAAGIDTALVTGVTDWAHVAATAAVQPRWLLDDLV
jgi:HAD superfamily hydrolase (TIGR01459 family)